MALNWGFVEGDVRNDGHGIALPAHFDHRFDEGKGNVRPTD